MTAPPLIYNPRGRTPEELAQYYSTGTGGGGTGTSSAKPAPESITLLAAEFTIPGDGPLPISCAYNPDRFSGGLLVVEVLTPSAMGGKLKAEWYDEDAAAWTTIGVDEDLEVPVDEVPPVQPVISASIKLRPSLVGMTRFRFLAEGATGAVVRGFFVLFEDAGPRPLELGDICNSALQTGREWGEDFCAFQTLPELLSAYGYTAYGDGYFEEDNGLVVNGGKDGVFLSHMTGAVSLAPVEGMAQRAPDPNFEDALGTSWLVSGSGTGWSLDNSDLPVGVTGNAAVKAAGHLNQLQANSLPRTVGVNYEVRYWIKVLAGQARFVSMVGSSAFTPVGWAGDGLWHEVVSTGTQYGDPEDPTATYVDGMFIAGLTADTEFKIAGLSILPVSAAPHTDYWQPEIVRNDPANGGHAALVWNKEAGWHPGSAGVQQIWLFEQQYERGWWDTAEIHARAKTHFAFEIVDVSFLSEGSTGSFLALGLISYNTGGAQYGNFLIQKLPADTEPRLRFQYWDGAASTIIDLGSAEYLIGAGPYVASVEANGSIEDATVQYRAWLHPWGGGGGVFAPVYTSPVLPLVLSGGGSTNIDTISMGEFKLVTPGGTVSPPVHFKIFEMSHVVGHIISL